MAARSIVAACLVVAGRLFLCVAIGEILAGLCWGLYLAFNGHGVVEALRGEVEDSLGTLEALLAIGVLCGGVVGVVSGFVALGRRNTQ